MRRLVLVGLAVLAVAGCEETLSPSYRLTMTILSGSSVLEVGGATGIEITATASADSFGDNLCIQVLTEKGSVSAPGGVCPDLSCASSAKSVTLAMSRDVPPKAIAIYHADAAGEDTVTAKLFITGDCAQTNVVEQSVEALVVDVVASQDASIDAGTAADL